jgi:hypothetical protein
MKLTKPTLKSIDIDRPEPTEENPQHMCLDKARREKKEENYIAMLHFACAWITYRAGGLFESILIRKRG